MNLLSQTSPRVALSIADCSVYDLASQTVTDTLTRFDTIDIVVSAGAEGEGDPKPFADMTPEEIRNGLMTRFLARMYPVHAALPYLRTLSC